MKHFLNSNNFYFNSSIFYLFLSLKISNFKDTWKKLKLKKNVDVKLIKNQCSFKHCLFKHCLFKHCSFTLYVDSILSRPYRATARNANSTLRPVLADVSMNGTLYSCANRSPSSRLTARSVPQSDLLPTI